MLKTAESGQSGRALAIESTFEPPRFDATPAGGDAARRDHDPGQPE